ncbi:serine protease [Filobacillus milosensis]|uniref:Serine protease n=1 Tax=Filobacillus milosensis TaxID=94137 RepID=A0A4Y8IQG1_9BACI|nr:serine protease [Filobacillus milosensis]TFB22166.1 serine protease [Filobacillus milosensis]
MTDEKRPDVIDEDLYEDIDEEEMYEILQEKKQEIREKKQTSEYKPKRPFPKWVFWLIALFMLINIWAALPNLFSLAAIDFVKTSAQLMLNDDVKEYKKSVVLVDTGGGKGTGFSFSEEGHILTNYHVIDDRERLWIYFDGEGPYSAEVEHTYPDIDLAVLDVEGDGFPHLELAEKTSFEENEHFYFIGNPLRFSGIANEGKVIGWTSSSSIEGDVLMLKAPVYSGNSGSPVINHDGKIIGVVYATRRTDENGKVGLAIPIDAFYERSK